MQYLQLLVATFGNIVNVVSMKNQNIQTISKEKVTLHYKLPFPKPL